MKISEIKDDLRPNIMSYEYHKGNAVVQIWFNGGSAVTVDVSRVLTQGELYHLEQKLRKELVKAVENTLTNYLVK